MMRFVDSDVIARDRGTAFNRALSLGFRARVGLPCEFLQELVLIQPVLKCLTAIDKNNGNLVGEPAPQLFVGFNVNLAPAKAAPSL
jgi:hypothetical protein